MSKKKITKPSNTKKYIVDIYEERLIRIEVDAENEHEARYMVDCKIESEERIVGEEFDGGFWDQCIESVREKVDSPHKGEVYQYNEKLYLMNRSDKENHYFYGFGSGIEVVMTKKIFDSRIANGFMKLLPKV